MRIGFAFTGAGHLLRESVHLARELSKEHEVTVFLSGAAEEVLKMYGLYENVEGITGGKYRELATDSNQKFSYPITGRLSLGKYDLLIVSPATANTVSKIVHGIADTLVTNAVAQARCLTSGKSTLQNMRQNSMQGDRQRQNSMRENMLRRLPRLRQREKPKRRLTG